MATVKTDTLKTLEFEEVDGAASRLIRSVLVEGLTASDYSALPDALDEAGVPVWGSSPSGLSNLVLSRRNAKMVPGTTDAALVTLEYTTQAEQEIIFVFGGASSAQQITSEVDRTGTQILVEHEFPDEDDDYGAGWKAAHPNTGPSVKQGGVINAMTANATITATKIVSTNVPTNVALAWQNTINSTSWAGSSKFQWMCTRVTYLIHDISTSPERWKMTFEFQYDPNGWKPEAVFIDQRTGKPPPDLIVGTGTKTVDWYPTRNFNKLRSL